ncbi:hypothetical protein [Moraxella lacunata]
MTSLNASLKVCQKLLQKPSCNLPKWDKSIQTHETIIYNFLESKICKN